MLRSSHTISTWRSLVALPVITTGGVVCRPTIAASEQQPGRERPRRPRASLFPALFGGRSRPGCPARRSQTVSAAIRTRMRSGIEPGIRRARRARSALQPATRSDWLSPLVLVGIRHSFLVGRFRATVLFPMWWVAACCFHAPSSPRMRIGADMQRSHRGWSVKYGATSQLA